MLRTNYLTEIQQNFKSNPFTIVETNKENFTSSTKLQANHNRKGLNYIFAMNPLSTSVTEYFY